MNDDVGCDRTSPASQRCDVLRSAVNRGVYDLTARSTHMPTVHGRLFAGTEQS